MYAQVRETKQNKSRAAANRASQMQRGESTAQFVENRLEAVGQRKLREIANNNLQAGKAAQLRMIAGSYPTQQQAPIQLRKYTDSALRKLVKEAAKTSQPNSTAILLAIYNEMRFEVDPTPAQFNSVVLARDAMIAANRIDAEDAAALVIEAERMQQAGGDPAEALRLRIVAEIAAKRNGIEGKYGHHVFQGDYNSTGIPTGFHSKADGSTTHEAYGTRTNVANGGAYQQSVRRRDNQVHKPIQSTFFPDTLSHQNVVDAITVVYGCGLSTVAHVDTSVNGMRLEKKGDTVFPAGGSDTRYAE